MSKVITVLLTAIAVVAMVVGAIAIVLGYYLGVPFLAYWLIDGYTFTFFLAIWLGITTVSHIVGNFRKNRKRKKLEEENKGLKERIEHLERLKRIRESFK